MEEDKILVELDVIFRDVLDDEKINLTYITTARDVDEWDSLNHVQLVVAIEKKFNIRFTASEIQSWKDVQEMIINIQKKLG